MRCLVEFSRRDWKADTVRKRLRLLIQLLWPGSNREKDAKGKKSWIFKDVDQIRHPVCLVCLTRCLNPQVSHWHGID
jgi:hypothetical protein